MSEYPLPLVNLQERFGERYLVRACAEYDGPRKIPADPFWQVIPCRAGVTIWPYGADTLGVTVPHRLVDRLLATGVILEDRSAICRDDPEANDRGEIFAQHGKGHEYLEKPTAADLESNLVFPADALDTVAEVVGARKRRRLSPERRREATERLRVYHETRRQRPDLVRNDA